jgi:methionine synthase I (cobalamin-dependent)
MPDALPLPSRSGSQKRQRNRKTDIRWDNDEYSTLTEKAQETGLSRNAYVRAAVLGTPGPRARRSPTVNAEALGRATAALNKVGSNLNQVAHCLNAGGAGLTTQECYAALAETRAAAAAIRQIVGRKDRP